MSKRGIFVLNIHIASVNNTWVFFYWGNFSSCSTYCVSFQQNKYVLFVKLFLSHLNGYIQDGS